MSDGNAVCVCVCRAWRNQPPQERHRHTHTAGRSRHILTLRVRNSNKFIKQSPTYLFAVENPEIASEFVCAYGGVTEHNASIVSEANPRGPQRSYYKSFWMLALWVCARVFVVEIQESNQRAIIVRQLILNSLSLCACVVFRNACAFVIVFIVLVCGEGAARGKRCAVKWLEVGQYLSETVFDCLFVDMYT